jgi:hypothetical protein
MTGAEDETALYIFERRSKDIRLPPPARTREDAAQALRILRRRLAIADEVMLTDDTRQLLMRYCTDTVLNILWYDRARKREESANAWRMYLMVGLMFVAVTVLCLTAFGPFSESKPGTAVFPLAFLAGGTLTVLQVVAALGDGKTRLAIFWKAGADLKEALYNFEHRWHRKVFEGSPAALADGFESAVEDELKFARSVTRAERLEFFANLRSPLDVAQVALAAVNGLRDRRTEVAAATSSRDEQIAAAKKTASEARAAVLASEFRLHAIAAGADKSAEQATLVNARAEVVRTEAILQAMIAG